MISSDQFFQLDFDKTSTSEEKKNQIAISLLFIRA